MATRFQPDRDFVVASVKREFASRYLGTQLGLFWAVAGFLWRWINLRQPRLASGHFLDCGSEVRLGCKYVHAGI